MKLLEIRSIRVLRNFKGFPRRAYHWFTKTRRRKILSSILAALILLTSIRFVFFMPKEAEAAWFDDSWAYRKKVEIVNSGSSQTDYQVPIQLNTAKLISDGKMQSDCDDIRVAGVNGTVLSHWIEGCNNNYTQIWTKVPTISTAGVVIFIYYGNPSAENIETGTSVFEFFDDFNDGDYTGWTVQSGTWSASSNVLESSSTSSPIITNANYDTTDYTVESSMRITTSISGDQQAFNLGRYSAGSWYGYGYRGFDATTRWEIWENSGEHAQHDPQQMTQNTWIKQAFYMNGTTLNAKSWYLGTASDPGWQVTTTDSTISSGDIGLKGTWNTATVQFDNVFARKNATIEPVVGTPGVEEIGPTPAAYWKFDEGYGEAAYDSSPNGNDLKNSNITKIEQQINIVDQLYYTNSTTDIPTDNSLGLVRWDADRFPNSTVYFEAVIKTSNGSDTASATLYNSAGSVVSGSTVSINSTTSFTRVRSNQITLTDDTDYTVRIKISFNTRTAYVKSARLIIIQSDTAKITDTQAQVELGNVESQSSSTATQLTDKKIYDYTSTKFSPSPTTFFEATLKASDPTIEQQLNIVDQQYSTNSTSFVPTDNSLGLVRWDANRFPGAVVYFEAVIRISSGGDTVSAALYDAAGSVVSGSTVSTNSTSQFARIRSNQITLTDDTDYTVRIKSSFATRTAYVKSARLIIIQSDTTKITDTQTQIELGNNETTTATSDTQLTDKKIYRYTSAEFSPAPTAYFEATLSNDTGGQTAYASLYTDGASCSSQVSSSEVSVTGTTWTRVRSAAITLSTGTDYMVCIKASANTARIANAKIILDQTAAGGITDVEIVHEQINTLATDADTGYTNQNFDSRFNPNLDSTQQSFTGGSFSYYYEATLKTSAGTGYAQLYNITDANAISNSEVTTTSSSYTRQRSSDITSNLPAYPQTSAKTFNSQLKNSSTNTTSASNSWLIIQVSNLATSSVTAYVDLYNITDSTQVSSSEVSTTNITWTRTRSGSISLTTGKKYVVRLRSSTNNIAIYLTNAKIIFDQANGIVATETVQQYANHLETDSDTGYSDQEYINQFNPSNFSAGNSGTIAYYFEATLKTNNASNAAYAQLSNDTDGTAISGSEVSTTATTYTLVRSGNLASNMPSVAKNLDVQLKNASTSTTSSTSSWLIIQLQSVAASGTFPSWQAESQCVFGKCLSFNGSDNQAAANSETLNLNAGLASAFTFQAWVRVNSDGEGNQGEIFQKGSSTYLRITNEGADGYADLEGSVELVTSNSTASVTNGITLNKWHHIAMTYTDDGDDEITLYIDDIPTAGSGGSGAPASDTSNFYLGGGDNSNFDGFIDEFKIYDEERTQDQIKTDLIKGTSSLNGTQAAFGIRDYAFLSDGLVGYWKLDELSTGSCNSGDDACDSSGNGNDGTWNFDATDTRGKFGNAITLDGTDDDISITDAPEFDITGAITVAAWVNGTSISAFHRVIAKIDSGETAGYMMDVFSGGKLRLRLNSNNCETAGTVISAGSWYHIAGTYDLNIMRLFVNGSEVLSCSLSSAISTNNDDLTIGNRSDNNSPWNGVIDEARVYNRTLSPSEINKLYNWAPGPVLYVPFDENIGTSSVYDRSGSGKVGTMNGTMTESDWVKGKFGSALNFDGSNDHISVTDGSNSILDITQGTTMAWIKSDNTTNDDDGVIAKSGSGSASDGDYGFVIVSNFVQPIHGGLRRDIGCDVDVSSNLSWHHVAVTYDSGGIKVYVDGVLDCSSGTYTSALAANNLDLELGLYYDTGYTYPGTIDDAKIYNYPRTAGQVIEDMNAGHPAPGSPIGSPVGYWKLDEGYGTTAYNSGNGGSLNATINGSTWLLGNNCKINDCQNIDTATDDITVSDPAFFDNLTGITASFWLNPQSLATTRAIISKSNTSQETFLIQTDATNSDEIRVYIADTLTDTSNYYTTNNLNLSTSSWQRIAVVYDANAASSDRVKVYKNAVLSSGSVSGTIPSDGLTASSANFQIGESHKATSALLTYIDNVYIYDFALTGDQIKADANAGSAASFGGVLGTHDNEGFGGNPPVGWWPMNENTGTSTVNDISGNDNSLTMNNFEVSDWVPASNAPRYTNGLGGSALRFDGSNKTLSRSDDSDFDFGTAAFAIAAWVKHNGTISTNADYILTKADTTNGGYKLYMDSTGHLCFAVDDDSSWTPDASACSGNTFDDSAWHHVAGVKLATNIYRLYVDGRFEGGSSTSVTGTLSNTNSLYIGVDRDGTSNAWDGVVDEVKIYNYGRSHAQVAYDFNRGSPIGWWKLDDCQGTNAYDNSFRGNTGVITIGSGGSEDTVGNCSTSSTAWGNGATGKRNASISLDGTDDYIEISDTDQLSFTSTLSQFSISAWIYLDSSATGDRAILTKYDSANNEVEWSFHVQADNNELNLWADEDGAPANVWKTSTDNNVFSDNSWHHVVGIMDVSANTTKFYVNGKEYASTNDQGTGISSMINTTEPVRIGAMRCGAGNICNFWSGQIDEVKIWNYALTADQVKREFNNGAQYFGPATGSP